MSQIGANKPVLQENKICFPKIHLLSFRSINQTNGMVTTFSNNTGENFNLAKLFCNVRVRL